tara:strand:- start:336 stop:677 length:342 start_codon:yes stop_codon:yes gene_type:complete
MSQAPAALAVTIAAGLITSILFSFLFTASLDMFVKDSELGTKIKDALGIDVNLGDEKLTEGEWRPAIQGMITLWLFFALMRIVHHNVDMFYGIVLSLLPKDVVGILRTGGLKE